MKKIGAFILEVLRSLVKGTPAVFFGLKQEVKSTIANSRFALLILSLFISQNLLASFEPVAVGARAAGMADAYTVVADDSLSLYYNPAGMMHVKRPEIGTYYSRLFLGLDDKSEINRSFLGYVQPLPKNWGAVGVSYVGLSLSSLYSESSVGLSYAKEAHERLNVGGTLRFLNKKFGTDKYTDNAINVDTGVSLGAKDPVFAKGNSKSAIGMDFGAQYRLAKNYAVGLALRNVNQPNMAIASGTDKAPAVYSLGLSRWTRVSSLSLDASNWKFGNSNDYRLSVGGERWFRSGVGMRAGLSLGSREYRTLALGGSYRMDGFQFDYALNYPLAGIEKTAGTHMVSMTFRFGKPAPDPVEAQLKMEREARLRAEAEMARLRTQLMEITTERPGDRAVIENLNAGSQAALEQAEQEVKRLREQPTPIVASAASTVPAVTSTPKPAALPTTRPAAKAKISEAALADYSNSLKFYARQVNNNAPLQERIAILERIVAKYADAGINLSGIKSELVKLKSNNSKMSQEYDLSVGYYKRIVQQGTSPEEKALLLERIIKKYKPLGVDTAELEKELESLKEKR